MFCVHKVGPSISWLPLSINIYLLFGLLKKKVVVDRAKGQDGTEPYLAGMENLE